MKVALPKGGIGGRVAVLPKVLHTPSHRSPPYRSQGCHCTWVVGLQKGRSLRGTFGPIISQGSWGLSLRSPTKRFWIFS